MDKIKDMEKMDIIGKLLSNNLEFSKEFIKNKVKNISDNLNPKYPVLILTCMNPYIDIYNIFKLKPGDVLVLKNAGNVYTEDVKRSILIAIHEYDIKYIIILGHTDCIMTKLNLTKINDKLLPLYFNAFWKKKNNPNRAFRYFFECFMDELKNLEDQVKSIKLISKFPPDIKIVPIFYDMNSGLTFLADKLRDIRFISDFKNNYKQLLKSKGIDPNLLIDAEDSIDVKNKKDDDKQISERLSKLDDAIYSIKEKEYDSFIDNYIKNFKEGPIKHKKSPKGKSSKPHLYEQRISRMINTPDKIKNDLIVRNYKNFVERTIGKYTEKIDELYDKLMNYAKERGIKLKALENDPKFRDDKLANENVLEHQKRFSAQKVINYSKQIKSSILNENYKDIDKEILNTRLDNKAKSLEHLYPDISHKIKIYKPKIFIPKINLNKIKIPEFKINSLKNTFYIKIKNKAKVEGDFNE
ncbi:MAG: carbonic anhydrase [Promethearchaeota archaeon]